MLHRHARPAVAGAFLIGTLSGALVSASALALLAGLLSPIPVAARATVALCGLVLLALHQAGAVCLDLPQRAYQIPQTVFHDRPTRAARRFAFELGTGVRTYITTAAPYGVALTLALVSPAALGPAVAAGALVGLGYGAGRALVVLSQLTMSSVAVDHPRSWLLAASWLSLVACAIAALHPLAG